MFESKNRGSKTVAITNVKILGISGTPILGGNCDVLVQEALKAAEEVGREIGGVTTEFISMADKKVAMCEHCQWCVENRKPCKIKDDAHAIFDKITECDGLILGGPTWALTLAPPLVNLFSRSRYATFFTHQWRNKVVGGVTVGFFGWGSEKALEIINSLANATGMIMVHGSVGIASTTAFGQRPAYLEHGVLDHTAGIRQTKGVGYKVVEVARMIKNATEQGVVLPEKYTLTRSGGRLKQPENKMFIDGVWREKKQD